MSQTTRQRQLLVAGIVTILVAAIALINNWLEDETIEAWVSIIGMAVVALTFLWAYLQKSETWAAVGTYVGAAIAFFILFVSQWTNEGFAFLTSRLPLAEGQNASVAMQDVWIPSMALFLVALPFLWTWLRDMKRWGFLIPAYILLAIIPILFMGDNESVQEYLVPAYTMFAVGLPFVVGYFYSQQWGLLVPGAILILAALLFVGLHYGLQTAFLTIGVPVVAILIGLVLLWRAMSDTGMQQEQ